MHASLYPNIFIRILCKIFNKKIPKIVISINKYIYIFDYFLWMGYIEEIHIKINEINNFTSITI